MQKKLKINRLEWLIAILCLALLILDILVPSDTTLQKSILPLLPLIGLGLGLIGITGGLYQNKKNMDLQTEQNKADRDFTEKMYNRGRADALADYEMMNEYNHPSQQMNRLRQAGLNPNLVYGTGAETTAAQIRATNPQQFKQEAPQSQFDISSIPAMGDAIMGGIKMQNDIKFTQAQTSNLEHQKNLIDADVNYKNIMSSNIMKNTENTEFDLELKKTLRQNSIENAIYETEYKKAQRDFTMDENTRQNIQNRLYQAKTIAETRKIAVETELTNLRKKTEVLQQLQIKASTTQTEVQTAKTTAEIQKVNAEIENTRQQLNLLQQQENIQALQEWYAERGFDIKGQPWQQVYNRVSVPKEQQYHFTPSRMQNKKK
jgi:hypothetical protein